MKKNILIFGTPRSGKSTLANMIFEKLKYQIIRSDSERHALKEVFPDLNINAKTASKSKEFQLYLKSLLKQSEYINKDRFGIVLEGANTSVIDCNELFNNGNNLIYYLGTIDSTPEKLALAIKENDTDKDWTYEYSFEKLLEIAKEHIEHSKRNKELCEKYGFRFVDTSKNRNQVLEQIVKEIEQEMNNEKE